jgi:hypothetical protein
MSALGGLSAAETAVVVVFSANAGRVDVQSLFAAAFANAPAGGNPDDLSFIGRARVRDYLDFMLSSYRYHDALAWLNAADPRLRALMLEALRKVAIERTGKLPPFWGHVGVDFAESSECLIRGRVGVDFVESSECLIGGHVGVDFVESSECLIQGRVDRHHF